MTRMFVILLLALGACASSAPEADPDAVSKEATGALSSEYRYEEFPGSRWYGPDGEPVSHETNIINVITAPEHCGWERAVMMHVGWPPGHDAADVSESRQFLRDPENVIGFDAMTTFDGDAELPRDAEFTGYRTDFMKLWLSRANQSAAYLEFADHVERWPRAKDVVACG